MPCRFRSEAGKVVIYTIFIEFLLNIKSGVYNSQQLLVPVTLQSVGRRETQIGNYINSCKIHLGTKVPHIILHL